MKQRGASSHVQSLAPACHGVHKLMLLDLMARTDKWGGHQQRLDASSYSSSASKDLFLGLETHRDGSVTRPSGMHYTKRSTLIRSLNAEIDNDEYLHELVCIVEPGCTKISGMKISLTRWEDDQWDPDLACNVFRKLVRGDRIWELGSFYYQPKPEQGASEPDGRFAFDIDLPHDLWEEPGEGEAEPPLTARLDFCDQHDQSIVYGSLFIRLVPTASTVRLLPVGQCFAGASIKMCGELSTLKIDQPSHAPTGPSPLGLDGAKSSQAAYLNQISDPLATLTGWRLENAKGSNHFDPWKEVDAKLEGISVKRDVSVNHLPPLITMTF